MLKLIKIPADWLLNLATTDERPFAPETIWCAEQWTLARDLLTNDGCTVVGGVHGYGYKYPQEIIQPLIAAGFIVSTANGLRLTGLGQEAFSLTNEVKWFLKRGGKLRYCTMPPVRGCHLERSKGDSRVIPLDVGRKIITDLGLSPEFSGSTYYILKEQN